jgi:hypothetical protein
VLYVADCSSLLEIPDILSGDVAVTLDRLTDAVVDEQFTFCDDVLNELKRRAAGEPLYTWAKAVSGSRCDRGADWATQRLVAEQYPAIVDSDDPLGSASAAVAQGLSLHRDGHDVTVITAEWDDKVTRSSVWSACDHFGIKVALIDMYLDQSISDD